MKRLNNLFGLCLVLLLGTSVLIPSASGQTLPSFGNVVIVLGENQDYSTSYNSKNMPYLTSLANTYGLGVNYYSDTHPSIGNYFNLTTGYILTDDDSETPETFPVSKNNIALEVQKAGGTWKDYVENLPSVKNCRGLNSGAYYVRHDPLEYMTTINKEKKQLCVLQSIRQGFGQARSAHSLLDRAERLRRRARLPHRDLRHLAENGDRTFG